jgi:hypothetical protein
MGLSTTFYKKETVLGSRPIYDKNDNLIGWGILIESNGRHLVEGIKEIPIPVEFIKNYGWQIKK